MRTEAGTSSTSLEEITSLERARELAAEWSALMDAALDAEPFLTPEWYLTWWEAFGSGRMKLLVARRRGRLVGVGPFRVEDEELWGRQRPVLRFWSNPFSNRANVVLHREHALEAATAIVDGLFDGAAGWQVARLGPILREAEATRAFTRALATRGRRWGMRESFDSPYMKLPATWDELEDRLTGSYRRSLRRKARKADETGRVDFEFGGRTPQDVDAAFEVSRHTWQHEAGTGLASRPDIETFYRGLASEAADREWLELAFLTVDGEPAAYEYNLRYDGTLYNLKLGYHQGHRDLSPGLVLKRRVLRRTIEQGLDVYDLLGEAEPYKMHWTDRVRPLGDLWIHRRGLIPRAVHTAIFRLRPFLDRRMPWVLDLKRRVWDRRDGEGEGE